MRSEREHGSRGRCPDRSGWTDFLLGNVAEGRQRHLSDHLESCADCLALVETIADVDGDVVAALRRPAAADPLLDHPAYARFVSNALALGRCESTDDEADRFRAGPGERLGRFALREKVGGGGYGIVWRAYDPGLRREVALKIPRSHDVLDAPTRERFLREARAAAGLSHPNVLPILDAGEVEGIPYIVMELCRGPSLARWQKDQGEPVPARLAAGLTAALAEAVAAAHRGGILHRDIKPTNVLLFPSEEGDGRERDAFPFHPKLADFSIARLKPGEPSSQPAMSTGSGAILGTPEYMAPEQAAGGGRELDERVDVWALGALLYQLLTGRPPFQGESSLETLKQVVDDDPAAPRLLRRNLPRDLETICLKCLEKSPSRRYASAAEVAADLHRWLGGRPIRARPVSPLGHAWRWCRRRPAVTLLVAALGGTIAASFLILLTLLRLAEAERTRTEAARKTAEANYRVASSSLSELLTAMLNAYPAREPYGSFMAVMESARSHELELRRMNPVDVAAQQRLARIDLLLASAREFEGRLEEGRALRVESIDMWDATLSRVAVKPGMYREYLSALGTLAELLLERRERAEIRESVARWNQRALSLERRLTSTPDHDEAVAKLSTARRHIADRLAAIGEADQARALLEFDLQVLDSLQASEASLPGAVLSRASTLWALGKWGGDFELLRSALQVHPKSAQLREDVERGVAGLAARQVGWVTSGVAASEEVGRDDPPGAWAERVHSRLSSYCVALGLEPNSVIRIGLTMHQAAFHRAAELRRAGKLAESRRIADCLRGLADRFLRSYPDRPDAHILLSEAYVQDAKDAVRADDMDAYRRFEGQALEAAQRALALDPAYPEAQRIVADRQYRVAKSLAGR